MRIDTPSSQSVGWLTTAAGDRHVNDESLIHLLGLNTGMDDDIRKKLKEFSEGSDTIIANPDDIEILKDQGLPIRVVPSKMAKQLDSFREDIRNPYSHYNIGKITQDVIAGKVKKINLSTVEIEEADMPAKENPLIQAQVKPWVDRQRVLDVFYFADTVVKFLLGKLDEYLLVKT